MKKHTTNYQNTFIEIAADCPTCIGEIPPLKGNKKSVANIQFELIEKSPYQYTSDEILFQVYAIRQELTKSEFEKERETFFSKGQPCFRASPLAKRYGFGIHHNSNKKVAIYGSETEEYANLIADNSVTKIKAMRSKRA